MATNRDLFIDRGGDLLFDRADFLLTALDDSERALMQEVELRLKCSFGVFGKAWGANLIDFNGYPITESLLVAIKERVTMELTRYNLLDSNSFRVSVGEMSRHSVLILINILRKGRMVLAYYSFDLSNGLIAPY
jgi:hypothetical protein